MNARIALLLIIATACGGSAPPGIKYYSLSGPEQPITRYAATGAVVALESMNAAPGLDGDQVAIRSRSGNIQYYVYHRWQAPIPMLVNELVAEVFAGSGHFRRVEIDGVNKNADLVVTGRIVRLEASRRRADETLVRVAIVFSARSPASGATEWTELYSRDLPVTEHSVDGLATALRDAIVSISREAANAIATSATSLHKKTTENLPTIGDKRPTILP